MLAENTTRRSTNTKSPTVVAIVVVATAALMVMLGPCIRARARVMATRSISTTRGRRVEAGLAVAAVAVTATEVDCGYLGSRGWSCKLVKEWKGPWDWLGCFLEGHHSVMWRVSFEPFFGELVRIQLVKVS